MTILASIRLNNVTSFKDRHGKWRWRFRKKGYPTVYLPEEPGTAEFMAAYEKARAGEPYKTPVGQDRVVPGSINMLCIRYYRSVEYAKLSRSTQRTYKGIIDRFRAKHGDKAVRKLERKHIKAIIAQMKDTPAAADNLLWRLKTLMAFALDEGMITINPTIGVKGFNKHTDGHRVWLEGDIAKFEKAYPSGTKERLALALLLYTAARGSDVARLGPQHIANNKIKIRAQKTKQTVLLPVHPALQAELNQHKIQHLTFLVTEYGKPYSIKGFQQWFSKKSRKAGLLPIKCDDGRVRGCTAHGLRKAAATRLADAGCTDREIMAVTGHKTTKEVSRYTESRDQTLAAEKAFKLLKIDRGNG